MPDLADLQSQSTVKMCLETLKTSICTLKGLKLQHISKPGAHRSTQLDEDEIVLWLISVYGLTSIFNLVTCLKVLPSSLTSHQKAVYIHECFNIPTDEIDMLVGFIRENCPTIFGCFAKEISQL